MITIKLDISNIDEAAKLLKKGEIVAFPTETVFGMGVIYNNLLSLENLKRVKGRDDSKPFTLMVQNTDEISKYAVLSTKTIAIITKYLPGPLTIIVPAKTALVGPITNNSDYLGIRVSEHPQVQQLIKQVGAPLLVPSANKSNKPPLFNSEDVYKEFEGEIAAVINGVATGSVASTIIKINDKITLVREGAIAFSKLERTFKEA